MNNRNDFSEPAAFKNEGEKIDNIVRNSFDVSLIICCIMPKSESEHELVSLFNDSSTYNNTCEHFEQLSLIRM